MSELLSEAQVYRGIGLWGYRGMGRWGVGVLGDTFLAMSLIT